MKWALLFAGNFLTTCVIVFFADGESSGAGTCPSDSAASASCIGDSNGDGGVDIADAFHILQFLFAGGPMPAANALDPGLSPEQLMLLNEILPHLSVEQLPDGQGGLNRTVRLTGVNLQVVNGLGATNGYPQDPGLTLDSVLQTNGLGNLIVGYDEAHTVSDDKTGSHNIVGGYRNSYSGIGGVVVGGSNQSHGFLSSITGGTFNTASGNYSSISGGNNNEAAGTWGSVLGGNHNQATGNTTTVAGGSSNEAVAYYSTCGGGVNRDAIGQHDWVAGALWQDQ